MGASLAAPETITPPHIRSRAASVRRFGGLRARTSLDYLALAQSARGWPDAAPSECSRHGAVDRQEWNTLPPRRANLRVGTRLRPSTRTISRALQLGQNARTSSGARSLRCQALTRLVLVRECAEAELNCFVPPPIASTAESTRSVRAAVVVDLTVTLAELAGRSHGLSDELQRLHGLAPGALHENAR